MKIQLIQLDTSEGLAEARRIEGDEWLLSHPWGDQRFVGNATEAKAQLRRLIRQNERPEA